MSIKLKIAVIGPTYPYRGGIPHYNTLLCEALSKKHYVECISFKRLYPKMLFPGRDQRDTESKEKISTKAVELIDSINPLTWLKVVRKIKKENPDIVLMYWWTPFFFPQFSTIGFLIKKLTKAKIIFLCHNVLPHDRTFIDRLLSKNVLRFGDYFLTHSKQDANDLKSMLPDAKVKAAVHPTYDVFNYKPMPKEKARKALGLKGDTIAFYGFVRKYKGLQYLLEAMPIILKEKDINLLIAGEFWELKEETLKQIKELGIGNKIKIVDQYVPNEDVGKYICAADIIVLPYVHATNSGIVQTAFGLKRPVIVTDVGGLPEVVTDNKTGFVVPSKNAKAIANAVLRFYKEKKAAAFAKGIEQEKGRFSWDRMVENIESFLR